MVQNEAKPAARRRGKSDASQASEPRGGTSTQIRGKLRAARQQRGLSLADVAEGTGISASFLSLVENGRSDITIGRLTKLIEFLGISITDLIPTEAPADPDIVRREERRPLHSSVEGIDLALLAPDNNRLMTPLLLEFEPGAERAEYGTHDPGTQEFLYVLSGELTLEIEGANIRRLRAGDSAYYAGDRPHLFRNASKTRPLKVLCMNSPAVL